MDSGPVGLIVPFRRDFKRDFANGGGDELLKSKVLQALMTEGSTPKSSGELPWRTSFGSATHLLRHMNNDAALAELARVHVRDCLKRWVPEAELISVSASRDNATLQLKVRFRAARESGKADTSSEVELSLENQ